MLTLNYCIYDCFAEVPFQGHAAAIVDVPKKLDHELATKVAVELCQTVTCFVWKEKDQVWVETLTKDGSIWPISHGLLGVAKHHAAEQEILYTSGGSFEVQTKKDTIVVFVPKLCLEITEMPERLNQAFDIMPVSVREMGKTCVVELRTVEELANLEADFNRIARLDYDRIVLTAEDDTIPYDYAYRYFSPKHNINENNGSLYVQTFLPLFWSERLKKEHFSFLQLSERKSVGKATISGDFVHVAAPVKKIFEGALKVL